MFDPYDFTDDAAGAKGCFKCGNRYGTPVYLSFSKNSVGCTACTVDPKEKEDHKRVMAAVQKCIDEIILPDKRARELEKKLGYRYSSKR
jgi:hypothetical protein